MFVKPGSISPLIDLKPIFILRYLNSSLTPTSIASLKFLITPFIFDDFGNQKKEYLPYARTNQSLNFMKQSNLIYSLENFYSTKFPSDMTNFSNPFSDKVYDSSPLKRVLEHASPGNDWSVNNTKTIKFDYDPIITNGTFGLGVNF